MQQARQLLARRDVLIILLLVNGIGTLFGFAWYRGQLARTLLWLTPFVPDSPLSSLFFVIALVTYLLGHNHGRWFKVISAFACLWLVKYGLWCAYVLLFALWNTKQLYLEGWLLLTSHAAMAFEAVVFSRYVPLMRFDLRDLVLAGTSLLVNDYVDYVYGVFPYLPDSAMLPMMTVVTPILSLAVIWFFVQRVKPSPSTS